MKNHSLLRRRPLELVSVLVATCTAAGSLFGQGTTIPPNHAQAKKEGSPQASAYALEISDGMLRTGAKGPEAAILARIADVLRGLYPEVNIVMAPELRDLQVNDLKLRATELPEALEALRVASGDAFTWHKGLAQNALIPGVVDPRTGLPVPQEPQRDTSSLYVLTRNYPAPAGPRRMVEVFNLSGYLEQLGKRDEKDIAASLEKIKMIVGDTLNQVMQGNVQAQDQPSFQFHPGANLFIVIGPAEAIEVAEKVIRELPGVAGARGYPPSDGKTPANDAFMRRYGLPPRSIELPSGAPASGTPSTQLPPTAAPPPGQ